MTDPNEARDAIHWRHAHACEVARSAGATALDLFHARGTLDIEAKDSPQDVVSRADREVEVKVRDAITQTFPDDAIIGEESASTSGISGFTWVIDPIDGTMPFLSGLPHWCVAIAILEGEQTVAAATFAPVSGTLYNAAVGHGFRCNKFESGAPLMLGITDAMTAIGASHRTPAAEIAAVIERLLNAGGNYYRSGSGALMLAELASGKLAGYYEPHMNAWDCLGGLLMVEEAGGRTAPLSMPRMLADGAPVLAATQPAFGPLCNVVKPEDI